MFDFLSAECELQVFFNVFLFLLRYSTTTDFGVEFNSSDLRSKNDAKLVIKRLYEVHDYRMERNY